MNAPDDRHLSEFLGSDPVVGNQAVEYFTSLGPECLRFFLPLSGDPPVGSFGDQFQLRFAKLCWRFGDAAIPILCEALEKGQHFTKFAAATGFDRFPFELGDKNSNRLAELLTHKDFEVVNSAMLALGYMGAYSWAGDLTSANVASPKRGTYVFEKLGGWALRALLLMIARTREMAHVDQLLSCVEQHFEAMEEHLKTHNPAGELLNRCLEFGPSAADPLIRRWLRHSRQIYREASLRSLSAIGLRRTATAVAERLEDSSEEEALRSSAASYLGDIGGSVAVETLERWLGSPGLSAVLRDGVLLGLSSTYPEATRPLEPRVIEEILQHGWQMKDHLLHSLGFRREGEAYVRHCLHSTDAITRGAAAISLARIVGADALDVLRIAHREATDTFERALVMCALIFAGEVSHTQELGTALSGIATISRLTRRWRDEFVGALATDPDPRFAAAWGEVMRVELAACQQRLAAWKGAYPVDAQRGASSPTRETAAGPASPQPQARDLIFISYSHADDVLCEEFLKMVRPTAQKHGLKIWSDHEIPVGAIWREEIEKALARTRIAVLLVSSDFLASGFIEKNELPPLLGAARTQGAHIFWIACRPCNVEDTEIGKFQGANPPSKPLSALSRVAREKEMQRISQQLFRLGQTISPGSAS
jgi:HEAT repeat protein